MDPLGYKSTDYSFACQKYFNNKPLGHGDAIYQTKPIWSKYDYVIVNFGGDASNPKTMFYALSAFDALISKNVKAGLILPAAYLEQPKYRIEIGAAGFPENFDHAKLRNEITNNNPGFSNVGIRIYRSVILNEILDKIHTEWFDDETGYNIPGNDTENHEFALDNADTEIAKSGMARIFPIALPEELTPVKTIQDIEKFEKSIKIVRKDFKKYY